MSSPELREIQDLCEDFTGLEEGVGRYDLMLLVKRIGQAAGFTAKMINLLDYYMAYTTDVDWNAGSRPIVFQSVTRTALDLRISERQVRRLEQSLFDVGAISWVDSGNHRRFGRRCPDSGRILFAYGVDLTPLAYLRPNLLRLQEEKELYDQAWLETKRQISGLRGRIRSVVAERSADWEEGMAADARFAVLSTRIRTHQCLQELRELLAEHKTLYESILKELPDQPPTQGDDEVSKKESAMAAVDDRHIQNTNQKPSDESDSRCRPAANGFQESVPRSSEPRIAESPDKAASGNALVAAGLNKLTEKQVLNAAGDRFRGNIPIHNRPMVLADLIDAGHALGRELHISQRSWKQACAVFTPFGAALCVLMTDRAATRTEDPVRKPAAYFQSLIQKAERRELNIHGSIMAILKREEGSNAE